MLVVCSCTALHDNQPYTVEGNANGRKTTQTPSPVRSNLNIPLDYQVSSAEKFRSDPLLHPRTSIIPACVEQATRWKCWLSKLGRCQAKERRKSRAPGLLSI